MYWYIDYWHIQPDVKLFSLFKKISHSHTSQIYAYHVDIVFKFVCFLKKLSLSTQALLYNLFVVQGRISLILILLLGSGYERTGFIKR